MLRPSLRHCRLPWHPQLLSQPASPASPARTSPPVREVLVETRAALGLVRLGTLYPDWLAEAAPAQSERRSPRYARHGRPARKITDASRSADIAPYAVKQRKLQRVAGGPGLSRQITEYFLPPPVACIHRSNADHPI